MLVDVGVFGGESRVAVDPGKVGRQNSHQVLVVLVFEESVVLVSDDHVDSREDVTDFKAPVPVHLMRGKMYRLLSPRIFNRKRGRPKYLSKIL